MRQALGLYIHIPFCRQKCKYCDFYSVTADPERVRRYVHALMSDIDQHKEACKNKVFDTLFIGGGTPTVIGPHLVDIIKFARKAFCFTGDAEMTIEANPESLTYDLLVKLKQAGINRISMGAQSFCNEELRDLGRVHDRDCVIRAYRDCLQAGFENINIDLMFGIGHKQCLEDHLSVFSRTLDQILELNPSHISCYNLTVQEHTLLYHTINEYQFASDENENAMYDMLCRRMAECGYEHYEISNFAKQDYKCRHNLKYWRSQEYLGLGPGAHSFLGGVRYSCECNIDNYISGMHQIHTEERLTPSGLSYERLVTGLRLKDGVKYDELSAYFNMVAMKSMLIDLAAHGLVTISESGFSLTEQGFRVSNSIICRLSDYYQG